MITFFDGLALQRLKASQQDDECLTSLFVPTLQARPICVFDWANFGLQSKTQVHL